jgi:DNA-binding NarL/FixJ family response regulator
MRKVVLAQHHSDSRHGLREILAAVPDVMVIGTAAAGQELLAKCRSAVWDVAVLDLTLPGENALQLVRTIRQVCPGLRVIVMSPALDPDRIRLCLGLGVVGYLASDNVPEEIGDAVAAVLKGATYLSRSAAQTLIDDSRRGMPPDLDQK